MLVDNKVFHSFNMSDNIKFMCVCGRRHWEWQGQLHGRDHGGWWHHDVSLQLECCSLRAGCGELCLCWVHLSVEHFQGVITSRFMTWHIRWRRSRRRRRRSKNLHRPKKIYTNIFVAFVTDIRYSYVSKRKVKVNTIKVATSLKDKWIQENSHIWLRKVKVNTGKIAKSSK